MNPKLRQWLILSVLLSLLVVGTGAILGLHLFDPDHAHEEDHDSQQCTVCLNLLILQKQAVNEAAECLSEPLAESHGVEYYSSFYYRLTDHLAHGPRAPPVYFS